MSELKQKARSGILWSSIERFSAQGVQFVLGIIIARILSPSDYGLVGMIAIFLAISDTFVQSGFVLALVRKKDSDDLDYSTVFYFNIVVACVCYCLLFFLAPAVSRFYNQILLIDILRVASLILIINSFTIVQRAKLVASIDFKTKTKASLSSIVISGVVGIVAAYFGFGVWALVVQSLLRGLIEGIVLWSISRWNPLFVFSYSRFKKLFSFGSKMLISSLLDTVFKNIYAIVIGKIYSANTLGFYTRARQFSEFPSSNITSVLSRVTFPVLSQLQDDDDKLRSAYTKMIKLSALVVFPLMMGLAALAQPVVSLVLTDKWSEVAWMLQLLCFGMMWYPIHAINLNVITVKGKSGLFLKLEIAKKILISIMLIVSIPFGIKAMILGQIVTSYLSLLINTYYTDKMINYSFRKQLYDLLPFFTLSFAMGALIFIANLFVASNVFKIIVGFAIAIAFYSVFVFVFNIANVKEFKGFLFSNK